VVDLYYRPGAASLSTHIILREIGIPYRLIEVTGRGAQVQPPGYLELNPHARVPTLVDGDLVIYEAAAVAMYLADAYPGSGLAPAAQSAERPDWYRWMAYLTNTVQATLMVWIYPERYTDEASGIAGVKRRAESDLAGMRDFLEGSLGTRTWMLSDYSTVDVYLAMMTRWARRLAEPWWDMPGLGRHYRAIRARPAVAEAYRREQLDDAR
jgi:glutathione S-transferase